MKSLIIPSVIALAIWSGNTLAATGIAKQLICQSPNSSLAAIADLGRTAPAVFVFENGSYLRGRYVSVKVTSFQGVPDRLVLASRDAVFDGGLNLRIRLPSAQGVNSSGAAHLTIQDGQGRLNNALLNCWSSPETLQDE